MKSGSAVSRLAMTGLALVIAISGLWEPALAQQVTIRRTFFRGWRYSLDGTQYQKLGPRADSLREVMKEYRICLTALNSYQSHVTAAKVTGLTSGLLIGLPLFSQVRGKEWIEGYTPMVIVGATMAISSLALEAAGSRQLKKAVMFYNRYEGYSADTRVPPDEYAHRRPRAGIVIGLKF